MLCLLHSHIKKNYLDNKLNKDLLSPFPENDFTPFEIALDSIVQKEDIEVLAGSFLFNLHDTDAGISNLISFSKERKAATLAYVYNFWRLVLIGKCKNINLTTPANFQTSAEDKEYWLLIFNKTIEAHFCGTVLQLLKNRIRQNLPGFLYHLNLL